MLVAKWDDHDRHSLLAHLIDVAAVAFDLTTRYLPKSMQRSLLQLFGDPNSNNSIASLCFYVASHDIGKATPAFQAKCDWATEQLIPMGFPFPRILSKNFHAHLSAQVLLEELPSAWPEVTFPKNILATIAWAVAGHHGLFPSAMSGASDQDLGREKWTEARRDLMHDLAVAVGIPVGGYPQLQTGMSDGPVAAFAGLVTVSDWVGSMRKYFPFVETPSDPAAYWKTARSQASVALEREGWRVYSPLDQIGDPLRIFGESGNNVTWNPIQRLSLEVARGARSPAMYILESSTGSGKTEASWILAEAQWEQAGQSGLYVAMPTMATSNQLHQRLRGYLERTYHAQHINLQLVHSQAILVRWRRRISQATEAQKDSEGLSPSAEAEEWFMPKKRSLLAPFGVGTVDQSLLASMQVRHFFVRLYGLAGKTVIFDEVHAYDTHMNVLFERLIQWLSALGSTVILLSATLPRERKRHLLEAYSGMSIAPDSLRTTCPIRLTEVQQGGQPRLHEIAAENDINKTRQIGVKWIGDDLDQVLGWLSEQINGGGCAVWICSTVRDAQDRYQRWCETHPDDEVMPMLFHARYPAKQREKIEDSVIDLFGKQAAKEGRRPAKAILFATQVVEQSLDLDFDVMVSDPAPIDLIIQRLGRLQRHPIKRPLRFRNSTPFGVASPQPDPVNVSNLGSSGYVYQKAYLLRSLWVLFATGDTLSLPAQSDMLVEAVYDESSLIDAPEPWLDAIGNSLKTLRKEQHDHRRKADNKILAAPSTYDVELTMQGNWGLAEEDDAGFQSAFNAATRLGSPSFQVVFLHVGENGVYHLESSQGSVVPVDEEPDDNMALRIAEWVIRVPVLVRNQKLLENLGSIVRIPRGWRRHPLLKRLRMVGLEKNQLEIEGTWFELDRRLGLKIGART